MKQKTKLIHGRKIKKNGRLWDVLGAGRDAGKVIFTGTLKEIRAALNR